MRAGDWHPIREGDARARTQARVESIREALEHWPHGADPSLGSGHAGLAVAFSYLSRACGADESTARNHLMRAVDGMASQPMSPGLFGGFSGIAWAHEHVRAHLELSDTDDAAEEIDEHLLLWLDRPGRHYPYDLIEGLVGIGVYALERWPRRRAVAILECVVEHLNRTSESTREGITWFTPPQHLTGLERERHPLGYHNLGVAHGVPGVVALLAGIAARNGPAGVAGQLLDGAIDWLWAHRRPHRQTGCFARIVEGDEGLKPSRLAWCYGDAGIAAVLAAAARVLGEGRCRAMAVGLGLEAARRDPDTCGVVDAGLCHGAAGLGHAFNRLFQDTQVQEFHDAAQAWFESTLDLSQDAIDIAGYPSWQIGTDGQFGWQPDPGLLMGAAGIAAALAASISSLEPTWDRVLLLSLRSPLDA